MFSIEDGFVDSVLLRLEYNDFLNSIKHRRADQLKRTECLRCGYCCAARPCIPTPQELIKIAKFLKMNIVDMVKKFFVADRIGGCNQTIIFPAKKTQKDITGTFISCQRGYDIGYCIFFDEEEHLCKIHPVRPLMAAAHKCWKDDKFQMDVIIESTMRDWKGINLTEYGIDKDSLDYNNKYSK